MVVALLSATTRTNGRVPGAASSKKPASFAVSSNRHGPAVSRKSSPSRRIAMSSLFVSPRPGGMSSWKSSASPRASEVPVCAGAAAASHDVFMSTSDLRSIPVSRTPPAR